MVAAFRFLTVTFLGFALLGILTSLRARPFHRTPIELVTTCPPAELIDAPAELVLPPMVDRVSPVFWADLPGRGPRVTILR